MIKFYYLSGFLILFAIFSAQAQVITREDSLNAGLTPPVAGQNTVISGYGQGQYSRNFKTNTAEANLPRIVTFFGHRFNRNISFFSELEIEDVKVEGGSPGGEVAMEQAFLKFNLNRDMYVVTGLFLPRIGIINENHLPTTFNGNERTQVETILIPSTWRELGVGLYGTSRRMAGLNYNIALVNGLNSQGFGSEKMGIREGRWEGRNAVANNLAVTGALLYFVGNFRIQTSAYYGGSLAVKTPLTDSLSLKGGSFGTPVLLNEANIQYRSNGLTVKALAAHININDASKIIGAYSDSASLEEHNIGKSMVGAYIEVGYNIFNLGSWKEKLANKHLILFSRYETLDLTYKAAVNGFRDPSLNQQHWVSGITYMPTRGVVLKADYRYSVNKVANSGTGILNLGFGYSF
ncbi:MAG: hypothetical protein ACJ75J_00630 [Cytophagaceae bacterium]